MSVAQGEPDLAAALDATTQCSVSLARSQVLQQFRDMRIMKETEDLDREESANQQ